MRAPRPLASIPALDVAAALGLALAAEAEIWAPELMIGTSGVRGSRPVLALTALAITLPLAVRRSAPLAVAAAVAAATGVQALLAEPSDGRPAALAELSDRELEALAAVARGLSNAEIARELFLSPATVKTRVAAILRKLGLRDRVHAVVLAYESGLVEPGEAPGMP